MGRDTPVFAWNKCENLAFSVDDEPHCNRLHSSSRQASAHFGPEQWRDFIADEPIENTSGLLGVDPIHIDTVSIFNSRECRGFCNLMELDALGFWELEQFGKMPCNGFAFAIRVGCEEDLIGCFYCRFEFFDQIALALNRQVARGKSVIDIDS